MSNHDIDKAFVSSCDRFLHDCEKFPLTKSQQLEINKHKKIALLRDNATDTDSNEPIWKDF